MTRDASVIRHGIPLSFHSDLPVAPSDPLFLAWSAVNRKTNEGNVVAPEQRICVHDALRAITIEAAYSWQRENDLGSIAPGKIANFTVLEQDPYKVKPTALKDIPLWGTVFEGRLFPIALPRKAAGTPDLRPLTSAVMNMEHQHVNGDSCGITRQILAVLDRHYAANGNPFATGE